MEDKLSAKIMSSQSSEASLSNEEKLELEAALKKCGLAHLIILHALALYSI